MERARMLSRGIFWGFVTGLVGGLIAGCTSKTDLPLNLTAVFVSSRTVVRFQSPPSDADVSEVASKVALKAEDFERVGDTWAIVDLPKLDALEADRKTLREDVRLSVVEADRVLGYIPYFLGSGPPENWWKRALRLSGAWSVTKGLPKVTIEILDADPARFDLVGGVCLLCTVEPVAAGFTLSDYLRSVYREREAGPRVILSGFVPTPKSPAEVALLSVLASHSLVVLPAGDTFPQGEEIPRREEPPQEINNGSVFGEGVLIVGALGITESSPFLLERAVFSNFGADWVSVFSPGSSVTVSFGQFAGKKASGTALAAAIASGVVGLMLSQKPDLSPADLKKILIKTARATGSLGSLESGGSIDAHAAVSF